MNAYELTRFIDDKQVGRLIKISKPAIYKCCKRLFKAGYLDGETVREGEMPEKVIYTVNQKGKDRFYELMAHFSGNINPFYFEFNSFLWNIDRLEKTKALGMLENLKAQLQELKDWIIQHEKEESSNIAFSARMIIKQYRMMVITLVTWIEETIDDYKRDHKIG
jgi:DNA-binding PadR family transcriptional regulator